VLIAFNKPFGVICKFRPEPGRLTLADYINVPNVYPAGRLDTDSEGLLLLTDDGLLQARIANPRHKLAKVYWAQVEGVPTEAALTSLRNGVDLGDFTTKPLARAPSASQRTFGRAIRRSAIGPRSRRRGSNSLFVKVRTGRFGV